jgi:dihydrofolate reductase
MGKNVVRFAVSLDGFIADAEDGVWSLFAWLLGGDTPLEMSGRTFMTSQASAEDYRAFLGTVGALVTGRRDFDVSRAWGGTSPMGVPTFIVTHTVPQEWAGEDAPFTFVTDGVESAIAQARQAAGGKDVLVSGSKVVQQALRAGLIDELGLDLVPVLLGEGVRLFENLGAEPIELKQTKVVPASGVTHLTFRVVK